MAMIKLSATPLDVNALYQALKAPEYGGIVTFVGTVRQWTGTIETQSIEYSAYAEMAISQLNKLAAPIEAKGARVVIVHRVGHLDLMDEAVFVGVAAAHRAEAFEWCQCLIDTLKKEVPIWKKEFDTDKVRWGD
ncbi:molybdenum cofactor biosynthesis protein MoaE [Lactiplantibacillus paraplantarum]|uniref:molybdenum cofactor biosynthesis protein MoaE n=1 Tax=Lactiplantibacillus paraplantarum TaxID=60520 RepID=UPI00051319DF|nr:molybdenum cofactor biosynthesis protein MoaE [Lactiplantibacillus paraplantarum]ALO03937.1 molybdenum cofactor biosynthesis protein E [Lactiplantibacillus paraplantarum]KGE75869.1 molybdenum cofactor biosynthesis protein E [Lactiplantibacillus paraplantarum]MCW1910028.1 molybdenum cofactor biosynthesis protein MoaE [Lactiplantibacillus paraplantarum]RDG12605.1 molybdenum cofactor biosynthesis protein MoaE [Lactiplantibacillus paraplantarum]